MEFDCPSPPVYFECNHETSEDVSMVISIVDNFIGGKFTRVVNGKTLPVENPATGEIISSVPLSGMKEVEEAVKSAQTAFPIWSTMPIKERAQVFYRYKSLLKNKIEEISYKMKEDLSPLPSIIHKTMLYSTVADIKNISLNCQKKKGAGAYIAAMFLHEFVPKNTKEWIHFDISNEIYEDLDKDIIMPNGKCIRTIIEIIKK